MIFSWTNRLPRYLLVTVIGVVGVVLSLYSFSVIHTAEDRDRRHIFEKEAENHHSVLMREIESDLHVLTSIQALYIGLENIQRSEFQAFSKHLLTEHSSIQALEWIPRIPLALRDAYEKAARRDGFSNFQITERVPQGKMSRAGQRKEYFPVYFIEPYKGNELALGFNLASNPARLKALELSRNSGSMTATARITLVQETEGQFAFIVFAPVYKKAARAGSAQERYSNLDGFVLGVYRIGDIVENSLTYLKPGGIDVFVYDKSAPEKEQFLYFHPSRLRIAPMTVKEKPDADISLKYTKTFDVAGRKWEVICTPAPGFFTAKSWYPWVVLSTGLLLTGMIVIFLVFTIRQSEQLQSEIAERKRGEEELLKNNEELEKTYTDLKSAHSQILQQEKMASIGQIAAGVAHEINNPVGYIMSNLGTLRKYLDRLSEFIKVQSETIDVFKKEREGEGPALTMSLQKTDAARKTLKVDYIMVDASNLLKESLAGSGRIKEIVQDLKSFSHVDNAEIKMHDINEGIRKTINVIWNELKYKAKVVQEYGAIPLTRCNLGNLNQVFMNILLNAVQAIEKEGTITIRTWSDDMHILISISDTGCGIPKEIMNKIFDPFFTTKDVGKGTGLGLSVSYDIIKKHDGEISIQSEVGKGTIFTIKIPVRNE